MSIFARRDNTQQRSPGPKRFPRGRHIALAVVFSLAAVSSVVVGVAVGVTNAATSTNAPSTVATFPSLPTGTPMPVPPSTTPDVPVPTLEPVRGSMVFAASPSPSPARIGFRYPDFSTPVGLRLNGSAQLSNGRLVLGHDQNSAGSAWSTTQINLSRSFVTSFTTEITKITDGVAFVVQGQGPTALGSVGGGIGYGRRPGDATSAIAPSLAVELDTWDNTPDGFDPPVPQHIAVTTDGDVTRHLIWRAPRFSLYGDRPVDVTIFYNAVAHTLTVYAVQHTVTADSPFDRALMNYQVAPLFAYAIDLSQVVGSHLAYVGFTGGTGLTTITDPRESILSWTFNQL